MVKPVISVIVPVFNAEKYLRECVESVISQLFSEWELLLIDDGSTDGSGAVCDEYAEKDKRIHVFHKENGGVSSARNLGLDNTQGEWIAFLDADDYFTKGALEALCNKATATGADVVIGTMLHLDNGQLLYRNDMPSGRSDKVLQSLTRFSSCGCLFKTQIINDHSLRFIEGLAYSEDRNYMIEYAIHCKTSEIVEVPVYIYRMNEASAMHSKESAKKAFHRFEAAKRQYLLALTYKDIGQDVYDCLLNQCNFTIRIGIHWLLDENTTREQRRKLLKHYNNLFGDSKERLCFLYANLPLCYARSFARRFPRLKKMAKRLLGKQDPQLQPYVSTSD